MSNDSKYTYPGTDCLINNFGIKDEELFNKMEGDASFCRIVELFLNPIEDEFTTLYYKRLHKAIFQDIYPWAGEYRTVNISKGGSAFCFAEYIDSYGEDIFSKMKRTSLKELSYEEKIEKIAYFYSELNAWHPFREGNGRTSKVFIIEYGKRNGVQIDFFKATKEELLKISVDSFNGNLESSIKLFRGISTPVK